MKKRLAHVALFEGGHITSLRRLFSRERGFERNGILRQLTSTFNNSDLSSRWLGGARSAA
jgi:hypothetical protein